MKSIDEHIKKDQSELEAAKAEGNDAKVRHFSEELESLQDYKKEHPGDSHDQGLGMVNHAAWVTDLR